MIQLDKIKISRPNSEAFYSYYYFRHPTGPQQKKASLKKDGPWNISLGRLPEHWHCKTVTERNNTLNYFHKDAKGNFFVYNPKYNDMIVIALGAGFQSISRRNKKK